MATKILRITVNAGERDALLRALRELAGQIRGNLEACHRHGREEDEQRQAHIAKLRKRLLETARLLERIEGAEEMTND